MGGRGGSPSPSALGQARKKAAVPEPVIERLKPKDLKAGMWVRVSAAREWRQIGSIKNQGRAGRNTLFQFVVRDTNGEIIDRMSPNLTLDVDRSR